jgi:ATP-binding cassette, subfamily C (CFTR/MRP), member 1
MAQWIQASQERVTATTKTLGSIKWLKFSGLNDQAFSMIQTLRTQELELSRKVRMLLGSCLVLRTLSYPPTKLRPRLLLIIPPPPLL